MSFNEDVVSQVNIYPVKSLQAATVDGEQPQWLDVCQTGFGIYDVADREYTIVEAEAAKEGLFVSQRGWDSRSRTAHRADAKLAAVGVDMQRDHLAIEAPGLGSYELGTLDHQNDDKGRSYATVHGDRIAAYDQGDEVAAYLGKVLGREVRLLRADRKQPRQLSAEKQRPGASNQVLAADGVPFLLASQASLRWLVTRQLVRPGEKPVEADKVNISRYRANIVIAGDDIGPFREDHADELLIGDMAAFVVGACRRCPIPNIEQETGSRDSVSSRLLRMRAGRKAQDESGKGVFFGSNLNHAYRSGQQIAIGDGVVVLNESIRPNVVLSSNSS